MLEQLGSTTKKSSAASCLSSSELRTIGNRQAASIFAECTLKLLNGTSSTIRTRSLTLFGRSGMVYIYLIKRNSWTYLSYDFCFCGNGLRQRRQRENVSRIIPRSKCKTRTRSRSRESRWLSSAPDFRVKERSINSLAQNARRTWTPTRP